MCHSRKWQQYLGRGHQGQSGSARGQTLKHTNLSHPRWRRDCAWCRTRSPRASWRARSSSWPPPPNRSRPHYCTQTHAGAKYHAALQRTERRVWLFSFSVANRSDLCSQTQRRVRDGCVHDMAGHPVCPHLLLCEERNVFSPEPETSPAITIHQHVSKPDKVQVSENKHKEERLR